MRLEVTPEGYVSDLVIQDCARERCLPGKTVQRGSGKRYGSFALHYVLGGKGTLEINGKKHALEKGWIFALPPHTALAYSADASNPWEYVWFRVEGAGAAELKDILALKDAELCRRAEGGRLRDDFIDFILYCRERGTNGLGALSRLYALISEAAGSVMNTKKTSAMEKNAADAKNYVIYNSCTGFTVADMSYAMNLNGDYLRRIFKAYNGETISACRRRTQLRRAAGLLRVSSLPLAEISAVCGFNSLAYFDRIFKKETGSTPSEYRKKAETGAKKQYRK